MSYYKMERGWHDSTMFGDEPYSTRDAFNWMIGEAAWQKCTISSKGFPVHLDRGQLYTSVRFMAVKFKWSKDRVARFLKRFAIWGAIRVEAASGQNLITVCNYSQYQDGKDSDKDTNKDGGKDAPKDTPKDKQEEPLNKEALKKKKKIEALSSSSPETSNASGGARVPKKIILPIEVTEYNTMAERTGLPLCQTLNDKRRQALKARLAECGGIEGWRAALERVAASSFLRGGGSNGWTASFDFLLQQKSFTKLMEGNYDDRKSTNTKLSTGDALFAGFALADIGDEVSR